MMVFLKPDGSEFSIRADLSQGVSILSFPEEPGRSRANSVNLFPEILAQKVDDVEVFRDDRLFRLCFQNGLKLSFKMYGQRSNLILHDDMKVHSVFNHHLRKDLLEIPMAAPLPPSAFEWHPDADELRRRCPGFTKRIWQYWSELSSSAAEAKKPELFFGLLHNLQHARSLFICRSGQEAFVSFFPIGEILFESENLPELSNRFYRLFWQINHFEQEKKKSLQILQESRIRALDRILLLEHEVLQALQDSDFRLKADLLMAYGQNLPAGLEKVRLPAFDGSGEVEIALKKDLSITQNAERLYRKSRGKQADLDRVQKSLADWKTRAADLGKTIASMEEVRDLKSLRKLLPEAQNSKADQGEADLPYHQLSFMQYEIRIGKNAKGNEELLRISHKDDHWLHARDVPGSHVLVRKKKNQNTPQPVLERAAELAAFHSKARNESLCPVMLTERKFVRKIKGAAAGQVKVEKEKTLLVSPRA